MIIFNGKQHIKIFVITATLLYAQEPHDVLYFFLGGLVGCLFPDVDHKESIAGHIIPGWLIFKHGKQTHTLLASLVPIVLHVYYQHDFFYGLWFGYVGHLIGDDTQGKNLKWLYYPYMSKQKKK